MTDEMNPTPGTDQSSEPAPEPAAPGDVAPGELGGDEAPSAEGREWLAQLQHMIDRVTAEAVPVARDVAAKAAELAAVAGEKAGPFARRAADVTSDVGIRVAERSRRFADDLRQRATEGGTPPPAGPTDPAPADAPTGEEEPPA